MKSIVLFLPIAFLSGFIAASFKKALERICEILIDDVNAKDDIQISGSAKRKSDIGEDQVARSAANQGIV